MGGDRGGAVQCVRKRRAEVERVWDGLGDSRSEKVGKNIEGFFAIRTWAQTAVLCVSLHYTLVQCTR